MNQTDSAWRKRQIALNKKAENARELGLDYEPNKTIREMAYEAGFAGTASVFYMKALERFADLVRADERNRTWTQEHWTEYENSIAAAEREACAKWCDEMSENAWAKDDAIESVIYEECATAIRARGQA